MNLRRDILKKILSLLAAAGEHEQVAEETVLILLDKVVDQSGVASPQPPGRLPGFRFNRVHKPASRESHSISVYGRGPAKDATSFRIPPTLPAPR